jgi:KDO2-lipid IV(A) lauroyltransferase
MQNLKQLSPELDAGALGRESRRAFGGFGESVVDTLRLSQACEPELTHRVAFDGLERLEQALDEGGAVLLGAHAGNWEWAGAALAARGLPIAAPARPHLSLAADAFFATMRRRLGVRTNARLAPLLQSEPGRALALFLDRAPETGESARPARIARGAAALAARRHWTLLPALCLRENEGYRIVFGPRFRPVAASGAQRHRDARAALEFLRSQLRSHRGQWFAFEGLEP